MPGHDGLSAGGSASFMLMKIFKQFLKKTRSVLEAAWLSYPKRVQCNICGWEGRRFLNGYWHKQIHCPKCRTGIRHRLLLAALYNIENLSFERIIRDKRILHFSPEEVIERILTSKSRFYFTTDFLRQDCDLRLDMSSMSEVKDEAFDVVIALDVLEHVPDYKKALEEVRRILSLKGLAIFTVPQKEKLLVTYENHSMITPKDRGDHFGQWDHHRIFGEDFPNVVASKGFSIIAVDEYMFSEALNRKNVLFPPKISKHPFATNHRKVFFCRKNTALQSETA